MTSDDAAAADKPAPEAVQSEAAKEVNSDTMRPRCASPEQAGTADAAGGRDEDIVPSPAGLRQEGGGKQVGVAAADPRDARADANRPRGASGTAESEPSGRPPPPAEEVVDVTITFKKDMFTVSLPSASTVADLKKAVERTKGVPAAMQKLLYKGVLKDTSIVGELKIRPGTKVMLIASSVEDLMNIVMRACPQKEETTKPREPKAPWSEMTEHKKVVEMGPPDDAEAGISGKQTPLPPSKMLRGMLGRGGRKTRLTFKRETDQLWIGTSEYTQKVPINSVRNVKSQPIKGREEYSIVALQLGPTDKSLYFLYYVPSQYVEALKDEIMGAFETF